MSGGYSRSLHFASTTIYPPKSVEVEWRLYEHLPLFQTPTYQLITPQNQAKSGSSPAIRKYFFKEMSMRLYALLF